MIGKLKIIKKRKIGLSFFVVLASLMFISFLQAPAIHTAGAETAPEFITTRAEMISAISSAKAGDTILVGDIDFNPLAGGAGSNANKRITLSKGITIKSGKPDGACAVFQGGSFLISGPVDDRSKIVCEFEGIAFDGAIDSRWEFWEDYWYNYAAAVRGKSEVSFVDCSFENYFNSEGGAITCDYSGENKQFNANIKLFGCEFIANTGDGAGGAVYLRGEDKNISLYAEDCIFSANISGLWGKFSSGGGAIYAAYARVSLNRCIISDNIANFNDGTVPDNDHTKGGGAHFSNSELNMNGCTVSGNRASVGGGIALVNTVANIDACIIAGNRAESETVRYKEYWDADLDDFVVSDEPIYGMSSNLGMGGGIYIDTIGAQNATLSNTSIYNNTAQNAYGGLYIAYSAIESPIDRGEVSFFFCTYAYNAYDYSGYDFNDDPKWLWFRFPGEVWDIPHITAFGCIIITETNPRNELPSGNNGYNYYTTTVRLCGAPVSEGDGYGHLLYDDEEALIIPESALQDLQLSFYSSVCGTLYVGSNACFSLPVTLYSDGVLVEETAYQYGGVLPDVSRTGYTFAGWTLADGKTVNLSNLFISGHLESLELYAVWQAKTYTATFMIDGKLLEIAQVYDAEWDLPNTKKDGYTFAGWYSDEGAGGERLEVGAVYKIDGDITLYAHYNKNFPVLAVVLSVTGVLILGLAAAYVITRKRKAPLPQAAGETSFGLPLAANGNLDRLTEKYNLTAREKEITSLLASGKPPMAIAEELFISVETVKKHIKNIYEKLDIHRKYELLEKLRNS